MADRKLKYGLIEDALGVGELGLQMGGGLLGALVELPGVAYDTLAGRGSPEMQEKYPGLGERQQWDVTKDLVNLLSYEPRTEAGQHYSQAAGEIGGVIDEGLRAASGAIPNALDFVPGEWPYASHLLDQSLYGIASTISPTKAVRGLKGAAERGMGGMAGDLYLARMKRAEAEGDGGGGLDIPWYQGGKYAQVAQMPLEVAKSALTKVFAPKAAYLSETYGLGPITAKELGRLEGVMDQSKLNSAKYLEAFNTKLIPRIEYYQSQGMTRRDARKRANKELKVGEGKELWESKKEADKVIKTAWNEYFNEIAKVMATERMYSPDSKRLKNLEEGLLQQIFPTSKIASFDDVLKNPQLLPIGGDIDSKALGHVVPFIGNHLDVKGKNIHWVTKPLEGAEGAGTRASAIASRLDKDGLNTNAYYAVHQAFPRITLPLTKAKILKAVEEIGGHNLKTLEKTLVEKDGYISFGTTSLTPDRLLATMNHRFVIDPNTGSGVLVNYDHYQLGANRILDAVAKLGQKNRFVVMDTMNFKLAKDAPESLTIRPVPTSRLMPEGRMDRDVVIESMRKKLDDRPSDAFTLGRGAEALHSSILPAMVYGTDEN